MRFDVGVALAGVLAFVGAIHGGAPARVAASPDELIGHRLPEIRVRPVTWRSEVDPNQHLGHPLLLFVYATWCTSCRDMQPRVLELYREYAPRGARFVALSTEARPIQRRYQRRYRVPWTLAQATGRSLHRLQVRAYPTFILVDAGGVVRDVHQGGNPRVARRLARALDRMLTDD